MVPGTQVVPGTNDELPRKLNLPESDAFPVPGTNNGAWHQMMRYSVILIYLNQMNN
jgi:hypothetical protein